MNRLKILIGVTGSVATIKLPDILDSLKSRFDNIDICLISTDSALHFVNIHLFNQIEVLNDRLDYLTSASPTTSTQTVFTFSNQDEWSSWSKRGDPVLHIELRKWADLFLIAPLDANTLAKISNGMCDNLLTCVARAWDFKKPILVCPAMNTHMYEHVLTEQQLKVLTSWGYKIVDSIEKVLVCGDVGNGAMAEVSTIVERIIAETETKNRLVQTHI